MAWNSQFNDVVTIQRGSIVSDGGGGQVTTWTDLRRFRCKVTTEKTGFLDTDGRPGHQFGLTISARNTIPYTRGHRTLDRLLTDKSQGLIRLIFGSDKRTLTYEGHQLIQQGTHPTMGDLILISTVETPEPRGVVDA